MNRLLARFWHESENFSLQAKPFAAFSLPSPQTVYILVIALNRRADSESITLTGETLR
jgi:hypothetical protein